MKDRSAFGATLGMRLRGAYLTFHRRANAWFAGSGMTADQYVVLTLLAEARGGLTQREVVDRAFSDPNTIAAVLGRLERKGLVLRRTDPDDGRARRAVPTPQGRRVQQRLHAGSAPLRALLDVPFGRRDRSRLSELLSRIPGAVKKKDAP